MDNYKRIMATYVLEGNDDIQVDRLIELIDKAGIDPIRAAGVLVGAIAKPVIPEVSTYEGKSATYEDYDFFEDIVEFSYEKEQRLFFANEKDAELYTKSGKINSYKYTYHKNESCPYEGVHVIREKALMSCDEWCNNANQLTNPDVTESYSLQNI